MRKGPSTAVTTIAMIASGLAGCESKPAEYMQTPPAVEWAAPAETTVINLDEFAHRPLQPEVQRWIGSTVLIRSADGVLSGQKVGPREVISAGHAFQNDFITNTLRACDVEIVDDARDG